MSLLVIGSVAFDAIETPFGKTDKIIGGAATYISLSASYCSSPSTWWPSSATISRARHCCSNSTASIPTVCRSRPAKNRSSGRASTTGPQLARNARDGAERAGRFDPIIPDAYQDCDYLMLGNLAPAVQRPVISAW